MAIESTEGEVEGDSEAVAELPAKRERGPGEDLVFGGGMDMESAAALQEVLKQHCGTFAYTLQELGRCTTHEMKIELTTEVPIYQRKRRMSPGDIDICTEKCSELLEAGLIQRSESDYAAATVVASRKDLTGAVSARRMCGDYRSLNKVTVADMYPMQSAEETFDKLQGAKVFSTLDLRQGFNQIPIRAADRKKTTFHGPDGLYEWRFMPFGMKNAPALFQRVMDTMLRDVPAAACYIDDEVVFSPDAKQHVKDVKAMLDAIRDAGLTCHPKKCSFENTGVKYLGFEVQGGQLGIQQAKVEVLDRVPQPKGRRR
ncbi:unnamed protein product [Closterium sp. Yama58-4]|nr:unnamed protein product [Closterium sp. Yama58-4]